MAKDLAIILSNGSLESCVAASLAAQKYRTVMMNVITGAGNGAGARTAYDQQVAHFKPYREHTLNMAFFAAIGKDTAAGLSDPRVNSGVGEKLLDLVPIVAVAARFAAHYQAAAVYLGLRVGPGMDELAQASEFVSIWNEMLQMPCRQGELEILTPLLELEEWQVVEVGFQVSAPMEKSWSCSEDSAEPCGTCRGCRQREAAFVQAGRPDPRTPPADSRSRGR